MSLIRILAFIDIIGFVFRFVFWEKEEFEEVSLASLYNPYFWLRTALWLCRSAYAFKILFTNVRKLEFVNVFGILVLSPLIGIVGEMILLNRYWSLTKLDWYGISQLGLEVLILWLIDLDEENKLRREREKERKRFRRDL